MSRTARSTRRFLATLAGLALAVTVPATGAAAQPDVLEATCTGTQEIGYSPGLVLLEERTTTVSATSSYDCLSAVVDSGTSGFTTTDDRSCLSVTPAAGREIILWDDGSRSVLTVSATVVNAGGTTVVTKTGAVTDGRFDGAMVVATATGPTISGLLACLTPAGVTHTTQTLVLEITSTP